MKEFALKIHGHDYKVVIKEQEGNMAEVEVNGTSYHVEIEHAKAQINKTAPKSVQAAPTPTVSASKSASASLGTPVKAPLPGVVLDVYVKEGDEVKLGQKLLLLEAMKMENVIEAPCAGKVASVKVRKGDSILEGADFVIIA
jgi:biotin carboxyl carrier protein